VAAVSLAAAEAVAGLVAGDEARAAGTKASSAAAEASAGRMDRRLFIACGIEAVDWF
jgi:conjugal transfer/entry exclusion protein